MLPPPPTPPPTPSPREAVAATGSTVGEAFAIAPDTYVVPGWWSFPGAGLGLPLGTLVVRGQATAVVDTAPAPLQDDWLAAVLALVDPAEIRWIVATAPDAVRAGCVGALRSLAPRATVVLPGHGCAILDLGRGQVIHLHEAPPGAAGAAEALAGAEAEAPTVDLRVGTTGAAAAGPVVEVGGACPVPGQVVVEVPGRRVLWTDLLGGAFARPTLDVSAVDDDALVAALARRPRPLRPDEVARTAALDLRVLGSPIGPVARGAGITRALALAERAEVLRSASTLSLDALLAPLGPPPWIDPTVASPASW